ncbi:MAG TPA: VOC family protein [Acidimicrobiales bacterium]|jgi:catechol 2,3-dioxygenase-like lactoylglutathione lyase family enzyme|nr:VOC family protein [Acidimicrobiales bacterium]
MGLELVSVIVREYDEAIAFFVDVLGCSLEEDSASLDGDGQPKRWVVVRPSGSGAGILLAQARGEEQTSLIGRQFAGRVGLFLRVDDFTASYGRMAEAGVEFLTAPRSEAYGRVAVFQDLYGNKWDLLGPA